MTFTAISKKWLWAAIWSFLYALFFSWLELWYALPGILLILDCYFTKIIPWKKLKILVNLTQQVYFIIEWILIIFTVLVVTTAIKTLFIEVYKIPTPSMEQTLMVGDYLFVSKIAYGPKLPNTPLAAPFMPNILPNGKKSYSTAIQMPYKRLLGFSRVKRNDIIVFNFPEGDTVVIKYTGQNYYSLKRQYGRDYLLSHYDYVVQPVDMRINYIKRCIGIPFDTLKITDGIARINGKLIEEFDSQQFNFYVRTKRNRFSDSTLLKLGISGTSIINYNPNNSIHTMALSNKEAITLKTLPEVKSIQRYIEPRISFKNPDVFPHSLNYRWTIDNFGSIIIPGRGMEIELNEKNIDIYKRIIEVYEKNKIEIIDGKIYINDVLSRSYTFKMNYYFVLGDNRHNSADSRIWGFVPEDHLVGKATIIFFSKDPDKSIFKGLRFNRMFKKIK